LAADLTPNHEGSCFRVVVALETASVFNHVIVDSTGSPVTKTLALNSGVALLANTEYEFWCSGAKSRTAGTSTSPLTHNWQVATNGVIALLVVDEVTSV
jgi:hypothetical protein